MRLADFVLANVEPILMEWEAFARGIWPGAVTDPAALRDDAEDMLRAAAADMKSDQTATQQFEKSKGKGGGGAESAHVNRASESHGTGRVGSGFDLAALISEYRALRATVIRRWRESEPAPDLNDLDDLTRFNESIDQSLTKAVVAYTELVERERQAALDEQSQRAGELREVNDALLTSSIRQHELAETAEKAGAASRESEQRYRALFDLGPVAVYACDAAGVITDFNRRAAELWGRTPEPGDTDQRFCGSINLFRPDGSFMPHAQCPMAEVVSGKIPAVRDAEVIIERPDGSRVTAIVNILPLKNERNEVTGAINCFYDITDRKQVENALDMAREEAETANRSKDRFLAVLSHELRTPLTPVALTIAAMELDPDLPFRLREDVAMIRRNVELEAKLIDDLLDLSRVTSGKLRLQLQPTSAHILLRQVAESSARDTYGKRLNVSLDLNAAHDQVSADPARLQQVFWNVLRNAIKFTPEGGSISVRSKNDGHGNLRLEVSDTGTGIAPDLLPRIFDAFEQGDLKTTRHFGGLGLGLAICKAVVEMHGGTIGAASDGTGKGATFTIELPTVEVQQSRLEPPESEAQAVGRFRVLLVEDHPDTVRALSRLLGKSGYRVKTAGSIASALQLAASEPFDIVVSDIGLPDGTGYELMEQMSDRYGIKGIALSGYGMEEDIRRSIEAGFADHVVKPVDLERLKSVMRHVVGGAAN